jgi:long-chain acyl-CoA synthetase
VSGPSSAIAAARDGIVRAFCNLAARRSFHTIVESPGRRATVGEIGTLSSAVCERLLRGRRERGLVGLAAPNGPAFLAGFLALRRAGRPVLLLDPLAPEGDRRRAVANLGASAVLECADAWPASAADFRLIKDTAPVSPPTQPDIEVVKLTSGSTGSPRGVAMLVEQLLADEDALNRAMGLRDDDRLWSAIPLSHSYGFTTLALSALVRGMTLIVPAHRDPFASLAAAHQLGTTVFPTVPAYIQALLKLSTPPPWPSRIRLVVSAGALLPATTAAQFKRTYAQPVHAFYGSSECGGICYDQQGDAAERGTVGTPVGGVRVSLKPLEQLAAGEGLVVVESRAVGNSYLPNADSRLAAGCFETSDVGTWHGGELTLRRRLDRVINVRGRKVDPSEVEKVLSGLEGVEEVVVIGLASPDGRDEIVRAVMACPSTRPMYREVAAWCRKRLADHKVPRSVVFVDAIPRTARGKIDQSALLSLPPAEHDLGERHG